MEIFGLKTNHLATLSRTGLRAVYTNTKIPNLGKFWGAIEWLNVGIFYGRLL
jgi:hypothetical protein